MIEIQIAFDPGSSLTKVIYRVGQDETPKLLVMEPEAIALPKTSIEADREAGGNVGILTPTNDAWLSYRKQDEEVFAIGFLAQQLKAKVRLSHLKYESAVPKFLAAIGAIVEREQLKREQISIKGALLLPYGEFVDSGNLETQIQNRLRSFYFRGQGIKVKNAKFSIAPEGGGFIWEMLTRRGSEWMSQQQAICILMLGHRNISLLVFSRGKLDRERSQTTEQGFAQMIDRVVALTSGQNRERLTPVIYELGSEISANQKSLRALTRTVQPENVQTEAERLANAIVTARAEYWRQIQTWFDEAIPQEISQLIVCGGVASYLEPEITRDLAWARPQRRILDSEAAQKLKVKEQNDGSLPVRLADIYAMFESLFLVKQPAQSTSANS